MGILPVVSSRLVVAAKEGWVELRLHALKSCYFKSANQLTAQLQGRGNWQMRPLTQLNTMPVEQAQIGRPIAIGGSFDRKDETQPRRCLTCKLGDVKEERVVAS